MHGYTRGGTPHKSGIKNKNCEAIPKNYNGHFVACNNDFSKVVNFNIESGAQETMHVIRRLQISIGKTYLVEILGKGACYFLKFLQKEKSPQNNIF
jgi:hypothetical protein